MDVFIPHNETMKLGEIAIVGPPSASKQKFLQSVCSRIVQTDQAVTFGEIDISDDLGLFLYGIDSKESSSDFAWDLVSSKLLGYIVFFEWYNEKAFAEAQRILDFLTKGSEAPVIVAADIGENPVPIHQNLFSPNISLSTQSRFLFCQSSDVKSMKNVLISLVDILIERAS